MKLAHRYAMTYLLALTLLSCLPVLVALDLSNVSHHFSASGKAECTSGWLDVSIVAQNWNIQYSEPETQMDSTQLLVELAYWNSSRAADLIEGFKSIEGTYSIYTKLCFPKIWEASPFDSIVQLLTHGSTLDHTYWDMAQDYSYVDAAADAGYATLSYDRVGAGLSDHPDPIDVVQSSVHVEIIHALVQILRNTGINGFTFQKVVGVGHSAGAWFSHAVADKYPRALDALVMTAVSGYMDHAMMSFAACAFQIASNDPSGKFEGLSNGYLVPAALTSIYQYNFYDYPHFDHQIFMQQFQARQTMSIGELLTILQYAVPSQYTGPVDVVTGDRDFICCGGTCNHGEDLIAQVQPTFLPRASSRSRFFRVPQTGHNINAHHRTTEAFEHIFEFLDDNNLGKMGRRAFLIDEL